MVCVVTVGTGSLGGTRVFGLGVLYLDPYHTTFGPSGLRIFGVLNVSYAYVFVTGDAPENFYFRGHSVFYISSRGHQIVMFFGTPVGTQTRVVDATKPFTYFNWTGSTIFGYCVLCQVFQTTIGWGTIFTLYHSVRGTGIFGLTTFYIFVSIRTYCHCQLYHSPPVKTRTTYFSGCI